jgi:uncharacterized membrane protein
VIGMPREPIRGGRSTAGVLGAALSLGLVVLLAAPRGALAQPVLSTAFPGVDVQPGQSVDFPLEVRESGSGSEIVSLRVTASPAGWGARLKGGGYEVDEAYVRPGSPQNPDLQVNVPAGARAGVYRLTVEASGPAGTSTLPLEVRVTSGLAAKPAMTAQYPELQGSSKAKYQFQVTLTNNGFRTTSFALSAHAPKGWQVDFTPAFGSKQIGAIPVKSGSSQSLDVNVTPPADAAPGSYTVTAAASAGPGQQVSVPLHVVLLGSYHLRVTTPTGRLNASATAGATSAIPIVVRNTGTAPLQNLSLTAAAPTGWDVTFKPDRIDALAAGASRQVSMTIRPPAQAIAGDYDVSVDASAPSATDSRNIRVTVGASTLWGWVGVLVVLGVLAGLGYLFRRLGRR